jgi:chromosome segregation ATPase
MEFEQIVKRLEFLDKQQRETKETLASLKETLASFETTVNAVSKQIKSLSKQVTDITPASKRVDQFETILSKQRADLIKLIEENEKTRIREDKETAKRVQSEITELNKATIQLKNSFNPAEFKKAIKERADETQRALNNIADLKLSVDETRRSNEDVRHTILANEEARKNDLKRIADLQGELTALRKRIDENREKSTIQGDTIRNIETRITDLLASELERKQAQAAFLDQQRVAQIDRERSWKDWQEKFSSFQKEAESLDVQIQKLDETLRNAKKAQDTYLDLNTKLERRINEVTEMQRLAEERLRQEWISFKADDQKRWTGYSLSSEESFRDIRKEVQKYETSITTISEVTQVLQDQLHQTTDASEKQLQEMVNVVHEWMTSYQRIMGHGKKTTKK